MEIDSALCSIVNTPPSDVAVQLELLITPVLGEGVVHLEDVDVLVHELNQVVSGCAVDWSYESVVWSRIDRSEIVIILITTHLLVLG